MCCFFRAAKCCATDFCSFANHVSAVIIIRSHVTTAKTNLHSLVVADVFFWELCWAIICDFLLLAHLWLKHFAATNCRFVYFFSVCARLRFMFMAPDRQKQKNSIQRLSYLNMFSPRWQSFGNVKYMHMDVYAKIDGGNWSCFCMERTRW